MKPEPFIYLSSTTSKSSAETLCAWIEDLGIPVLMAHEGDQNIPKFSIYVPESQVNIINKKVESQPYKPSSTSFKQAFGL